MNYYIKIAGLIIIGYVVLLFLYIIFMALKMYFDDHGYPELLKFIKNH